MNRELPRPDPARSWREIPQQVKPRAMSSGGRRRLVISLLGWAGGLAALGFVCLGAWKLADAWRNPGALPAGARGAPLKQITLVDPDGVLDHAWLVRTLALRPDATLVALDLSELRRRVLAGGQVADAALLRIYPATLSVHLSERSPVARLMAQGPGGEPVPYLVARDGTVYQGVGYAPALIGSLPWIGGVILHRQGAGFAPLAGMDAVAQLLAEAKLETEPLYRTWRVVSLARLAKDGEIQVRTAGGLTVTFGTEENFTRQLAKLDYLLDTLRQHGAPPPASIDLSLAYANHLVSVTLAGAAASNSPASSAPFYRPPPSVSREF